MEFHPMLADSMHDEEIMDAGNKDAEKFGNKVDIGGAVQAIGRQIVTALEDPKYNVNEKVRCWNTKPCSSASKGFHTKIIAIDVTYQFYREEKDANGRIVRVNGPKKTMLMREYYVPDKSDPVNKSYDSCRCAVIEDVPDDEHASTGGVYQDGHPATTTETAQANLNIFFGDMNSYSVAASNPTMKPITFEIFPGTICYPGDPMFQTMMITQPIKLILPPMQTASVMVPSGGSSPLSFVSEKGAAVCLNMQKKEPNENVVYSPAGCDDDRLMKLANFATKEASRGSWTQSRIWIYTDNATIDQIQKLLNPGPTEGHYLRSLYHVATVANVDFTEKERQRCLDPRLIAGSSATTEGTQWFVKIMEKVDPKALSQYVIDNPDAFENLFVARAGTLGLGHAVDVANALLASPNADLQKAGLAFLQHSIPKERMADFVEAGGLSGLSRLLDSEKPEMASAAMDVAEAMPYRALTIGLCNLPKGITPELRERASKLLKNLK